jgi:hypothetical protein
MYPVGALFIFPQEASEEEAFWMYVRSVRRAVAPYFRKSLRAVLSVMRYSFFGMPPAYE